VAWEINKGGEEEKEKIGNWKHIDALFFTHLILLEIYQWDDSNYAMEDQQIRS